MTPATARAFLHRMRMAPAEGVFGPAGDLLCDQCHAGVEIAAQERRVAEARLKAQGVPAWALQQARGTQDAGARKCSRCGEHAVVVASVTHQTGARGYGGADVEYRCGACGRSYVRGVPIVSQLLGSLVFAPALGGAGVWAIRGGDVWPWGVGLLAAGVGAAVYVAYNVRRLWGWG